jgi:uncharacterized protein YqeY
MGLKERLRADLTDAMRSRDELRRSALRMVLTSISKAEVAGKELRTLSDDEVIGVVRSELGKRTEAAGIYDDAGRAELASRERAEAEVLAQYLPPEMDDDALRAVVAEEVARASGSGVSGPKAMGVVIKAVRGRVGAQAEGGRIAAEVRAALGVPS